MTPAEKQEMLEMVRAMIGDMHDMTESILNAKVDAIVDGHKRMSASGMPDWMIAEVLVALAGGDSRRKHE